MPPIDVEDMYKTLEQWKTSWLFRVYSGRLYFPVTCVYRSLLNNQKNGKEEWNVRGSHGSAAEETEGHTPWKLILVDFVGSLADSEQWGLLWIYCEDFASRSIYGECCNVVQDTFELLFRGWAPTASSSLFEFLSVDKRITLNREENVSVGTHKAVLTAANSYIQSLIK